MATLRQNQPDQLNTENAPLKNSFVISSTGPEDLNRAGSGQIAQGLLNLHSKLDKALSKSHIFAKPLNIDTSMAYGNSLIEERQVLSSRLYEDPRMTAPVVYETRSPQAYNPYGYEVKTLASLNNVVPQQFNSYASPAVSQQFNSYASPAVPQQFNSYASPARVVRPEMTYQSHPHMFWSQPRTPVYQPTSPALSMSAVQFPHSAGYPVPQQVHYHQAPMIHQQFVQPQNMTYVMPAGVSYVQSLRDRDYYCGELINDSDSVISDYLDNRDADEELFDEEEEEDPRIKTVGKKPQVNNKAVKPVATKPVAANNNSEFIKKGPYTQQKKQNITPKEAKKYFDKPNQIQDFDFGRK
jgi:hypothetical protein